MYLLTNNVYVLLAPETIDAMKGSGQVAVHFPQGENYLLGFEDPEMGKQWIDRYWKEAIIDSQDPLYPLGLLPVEEKGEENCIRYLLSRLEETPFSYIRILTKSQTIEQFSVEELKRHVENQKEEEIESLNLYQFDFKYSKSWEDWKTSAEEMLVDSHRHDFVDHVDREFDLYQCCSIYEYMGRTYVPKMKKKMEPKYADVVTVMETLRRAVMDKMWNHEQWYVEYDLKTNQVRTKKKDKKGPLMMNLYYSNRFESEVEAGDRFKLVPLDGFEQAKKIIDEINPGIIFLTTGSSGIFPLFNRDLQQQPNHQRLMNQKETIANVQKRAAEIRSGKRKHPFFSPIIRLYWFLKYGAKATDRILLFVFFIVFTFLLWQFWAWLF